MSCGRFPEMSNDVKYLIFGFDMETDVGSTSRDYHGVQQGTPAILDILIKHSIKATFLFTGDCARKNSEIVELVDTKGFEIGCHSLYHEDLGEPTFNSSSVNPILEEELENRLKLNVSILKNVINKDPVSFRSPRGFGSNKLMQVLEKLNFEIDSSYMQSLRLNRHFPYFVSRDDWEKEGDSTILELPLFAFDMDNVADNVYQVKLDQWPRIRTHGADFVLKNMKPIVEKQLHEHGFSMLTFYLHPWEFYEMPKTRKYAEGTIHYDEFLYKNTGKKQVREFDQFVEMCLEEGFQFVDFRTARKIFSDVML
jgi:peptidoglycan/xylan/chitin deacetylase (PgdA/CDA1 family)